MSNVEQWKCKSYVDDNSDVQDCTCGKCAYQHTVRRWKEAYKDVLRVCERYDHFKDKYDSSFRDIDDMKMSAKNHLMLIEWYEKYGLRVDHDHKPYSYNFIEINRYVRFNHFEDAQKDKDNGSGKYISWSDDGRQPLNEWLLNISFPTGAYIFGSDYNGQRTLFQDFFDELNSYNPDYSDTHNNNLYWKLENAKPIYDEFNTILRKYEERNQAELKQRKIEALRKDLEKLEGATNAQPTPSR